VFPGAEQAFPPADDKIGTFSAGRGHSIEKADTVASDILTPEQNRRTNRQAN
jgi:hypothetical protein